MKNSKLFLSIVMIFSFFLQQCCTSQNEVKDMDNFKKGIRFSKPLPVGMVELSCTIVEVFERDDKQFCTAKIYKVHGYGSGVRALAEDHTYEFEIDNRLNEKSKFKNYIGKTVRCKLVNMPGGMNQKITNSLKLISINNS